MKELLARWVSRGGRWCAELERTSDGYTLREYKHGKQVGACYRPVEWFRGLPWHEFNVDATACRWAAQQVREGFNVAMERKALRASG